MSAYIVASYNITNAEGFEPYPGPAVESVGAHGGEIIIADFDSDAVEGTPAAVTVVIRFADKAAAKAWHGSDDYQAVIHGRLDNTEGTMALVDGTS